LLQGPKPEKLCQTPLPEPIFPPTYKERLTAVFIFEPFILKTSFLVHSGYKTLINCIQMFVGDLKSRKKKATIHGQLKKILAIGILRSSYILPCKIQN